MYKNRNKYQLKWFMINALNLTRAVTLACIIFTNQMVYFAYFNSKCCFVKTTDILCDTYYDVGN